MKFSRDYGRTGGVGDPETTDLDRRSQDLVRFGKVKEVDYKRSPPSYRVEIGDPSDEDNYIVTDWLPAGGARSKGDSETHFLEVGEGVTLLAEGGELSTAKVIPSGTYNDDDQKAGADKAGVWRKKFQNGAEISYDRNSGAMTFDATGSGDLTMKAGGATITIKGGKISMSAGGSTFELGGDGPTFTGGTMTHEGKNVGKDHGHVSAPPGPPGPPV